MLTTLKACSLHLCQGPPIVKWAFPCYEIMHPELADDSTTHCFVITIQSLGPFFTDKNSMEFTWKEGTTQLNNWHKIIPFFSCN